MPSREQGNRRSSLVVSWRLGVRKFNPSHAAWERCPNAMIMGAASFGIVKDMS